MANEVKFDLDKIKPWLIKHTKLLVIGGLWYITLRLWRVVWGLPNYPKDAPTTHQEALAWLSLVAVTLVTVGFTVRWLVDLFDGD